MAKSSKRWVQDHERDEFVKKARQSHYRSRAVYKLQEIDNRDSLFQPGQHVVDLGAAPGSWSQYVSERVGDSGYVISIDILPIETLNKVRIIQGDFTEQKTLDECLQILSGKKVDVVISDMAPNISGIKSTDQARIMYLAELAYDFVHSVLKPGGSMLIKVFQGQGTDQFRAELIQCFQRVIIRKPKASRDSSSELYILAQGYNV